MRRWIEGDMGMEVAPASVRARRNLEALLDGYDERRIRLVVRDVASDPERAESDHVVFTPTS